MSETESRQKPITGETRCVVCGPVEGRVAHEPVDVDADADRLDVAEQYLRDRGRDPADVDAETLVETLDHLSNLRRREMGLSTRAELVEEFGRNVDA